MGPALDRMTVEPAIRALLSETEARRLGRLSGIQLLNHRPGRRCVLSYSFSGTQSESTPEEAGRFVGKIRAKGPNRRSDGTGRKLRALGFTEAGRFAFTVAEPLGVIPSLDMTLQRFHAGPDLTELVLRGGRMPVERFAQVGAALFEFHGSGVPTDRRYTVGNELVILEERLPRVAEKIPEYAGRIHRVLEGARPVAEALAKRPVRSIHRDFYPDQVIAQPHDLVLLDLDLYTMGDPALDVGNFVAHLQELGLRSRGEARAFREVEAAFVDAYLAASTETTYEDVQRWSHLSLIRHIDIAWRIEERRSILPGILRLCEEWARDFTSG